MLQCLNSKAPVDLAAKLQLESAQNMLLDSSTFMPLSNFGRRAFSYQAPRLWNSLSLELRICTELNTFKAHLKHFLFDYFSDYVHNIDPYTSFTYTQPSMNNYSVQRRRYTSVGY